MKLSPAVEWLERKYDDWEMHYQPSYLGEEPINVVRVANMHEVADFEGCGHNQPWIRIKDDWAPRWDEMTQEQIDQAYSCWDCANRAHRCSACRRPITHMAMGDCVDCMLNPYDAHERRMEHMREASAQAAGVQAAGSPRAAVSGLAAVSMVRGDRPSPVRGLTMAEVVISADAIVRRMVQRRIGEA